VGEIFKKIVLEGEYIPKGEPEPIPKAEQQSPEYITPNDENNIKRLVWDISAVTSALKGAGHSQCGQQSGQGQPANPRKRLRCSTCR
jgi:hypothetical protein